MAASGASEAVAELRTDPRPDGPRTSTKPASASRWTDRAGVEGTEATYVAIGARPGRLAVRRADDEMVIAKLLGQTGIPR